MALGLNDSQVDIALDELLSERLEKDWSDKVSYEEEEMELEQNEERYEGQKYLRNLIQGQELINRVETYERSIWEAESAAAREREDNEWELERKLINRIEAYERSIEEAERAAERERDEREWELERKREAELERKEALEYEMKIKGMATYRAYVKSVEEQREVELCVAAYKNSIEEENRGTDSSIITW